MHSRNLRRCCTRPTSTLARGGGGDWDSVRTARFYRITILVCRLPELLYTERSSQMAAAQQGRPHLSQVLGLGDGGGLASIDWGNASTWKPLDVARTAIATSRRCSTLTYTDRLIWKSGMSESGLSFASLKADTLGSIKQEDRRGGRLAVRGPGAKSAYYDLSIGARAYHQRARNVQWYRYSQPHSTTSTTLATCHIWPCDCSRDRSWVVIWTIGDVSWSWLINPTQH